MELVRDVHTVAYESRRQCSENVISTGSRSQRMQQVEKTSQKLEEVLHRTDTKSFNSHGDHSGPRAKEAYV